MHNPIVCSFKDVAVFLSDYKPTSKSTFRKGGKIFLRSTQVNSNVAIKTILTVTNYHLQKDY